MLFKKKALFAPMLACCAAFVAAGCGDSGNARLRIVHDSADAPNVDAFVGSTRLVSNAAFEAATPYVVIGAGNRTVKVNPAGSETSVIKATVDFVKGTDTTILAINPVANIGALVATDDNTVPPAGDFKLRVIHGSPTAAPVDIYVTAPGADLSSAKPVLTNVPYKAVSQYFSLPAGSYELRVTPTGSQKVAIDSGSVAFSSGQVRTVVARDAKGGGLPLGAILLSDVN